MNSFKLPVVKLLLWVTSSLLVSSFTGIYVWLLAKPLFFILTLFFL